MEEEEVTVALRADTKPFEDALEGLKDLSQGFGSQLTSALKGAAVSGRSLEDVLRRIGLNLAGMALNQGLAPLQQLGSGLFSKLTGALVGAIGFERGGVWRALYGGEPEKPGPYAPDWAESGGREELLLAARRQCHELGREEISPGRLLIFRWRRGFAAKHAGIAVDADSFIHAYEGHAVLVSPLVPQWRDRIAGVFAFPPVTREDQG